jgi:hypothetical protein
MRNRSNCSATVNPTISRAFWEHVSRHRKLRIHEHALSVRPNLRSH